MNEAGRSLWLGLHLLDRQVLDCDGQPVAKVDDMLNGGEATPYQITAAEALLARWAGVPSRPGGVFQARAWERAVAW